jgi:hypothetical protein
MSRRTSSQCTVWTRMNASCHAGLVHAANRITLGSELLHIIKKLNVAYGTSWKSRKTCGKKRGQDIGFIYLKLVNGSVCRNIPAESTKTRPSYIIYRTNDMITGDSKTERPRCFWMYLIISWNGILGGKNDGMNFKQNHCTPNDC